MSFSNKVLSKGIKGTHTTVSPFINLQKYSDTEEGSIDDEDVIFVKSGDFIEINSGKIALNFFCKTCDDTRTFISPEKLHCLIINKNLISIDTFLECPTCKTMVQIWFLVEVQDLFSAEPKARIMKRTQKLTDNVTVLNVNDYGYFTEMLEKAVRASNEGFGSGSIIYLRKVFEQITTHVANDKGISLKTDKMKRKTFKDLLREVDETAKIIPTEFSNNGYNLFGKLSDVIHGEYDEEIALDKFNAFYRLIVGVIDNIRNKKEFRQALNAIGITTGGENTE